MSIISLIRVNNVFPDDLIYLTYSFFSSIGIEGSASNSENPRIAFMGVRISCDMFARKLDFSISASSAFSLAIRSSFLAASISLFLASSSTFFRYIFLQDVSH